MYYYHVCQNWDGLALMPLAEQVDWDDNVAEALAEKWPEASPYWIYYVHGSYVHMYDTLQQAQDHAAEHGGSILQVDMTGLAVYRDIAEFNHPIYAGIVGGEKIRLVN